MVQRSPTLARTDPIVLHESDGVVFCGIRNGRHPGQRAKLANEVRLIRIPGLCPDRRPVASRNRSLRSLVRVVRAEMLLSGATAADVAAALRSAVTEHQELSTLDRTNVVTRRLASEELIEQMMEWLRDAESAS